MRAPELPYASLEPSLPRSEKLTKHNSRTFNEGVTEHLTNGNSRSHANGTNGNHIADGSGRCQTNGTNKNHIAKGINDRNEKSTVDQPIAVIGMGLRFPQDATSPEKFWDMLMEGRSARTEVPTERYNVDSHYRSDTSLPETVSSPQSNQLNIYN